MGPENDVVEKVWVQATRLGPQSLKLSGPQFPHLHNSNYVYIKVSNFFSIIPFCVLNIILTTG